MSIRRFATLLLWAAGSINAANASPPSAAAAARLKQIMEQAQRRPPVALPSAEHEARMRERTRLLRRGEAALARADVDDALQAFDQAAGILHAADTEMGLVRTYMQGGEYRRAVAFVAHTAQAHRETPSGAVLYAWLLYVGGHAVNAKRILSDAETLFPGDALLAVARQQLDSRMPIAAGPLLKAPARLAPFGPAVGLPPFARVAGTGVLTVGGTRAVVPVATIKNATTLWVRNGLGQFSRASIEKRVVAGKFAVVRLDTPIEFKQGFALAGSGPFPGSPAFAVEHVATADATPSWPLLSGGFIGRPSVDGTQRQLGIDLPTGPRGGPVFDGAGRLVGIALPDGDGNDLLVPISELGEPIGSLLGVPAPPASNQRMPVDQIYEAALRTTVQVITARR